MGRPVASGTPAYISGWSACPKTSNPGFDATGERCGFGQFGPVFFLAGNFGPGNAEGVNRTCVVAEGTVIYAGVAGTNCSTLEPPPYFGRTEDELRACAMKLWTPRRSTSRPVSSLKERGLSSAVSPEASRCEGRGRSSSRFVGLVVVGWIRCRGCRRQVCAARGLAGCPRGSVISSPRGRGMVFFGSDQVDAINGTTTPKPGVMTNARVRILIGD